jgi:hypothetical protein
MPLYLASKARLSGQVPVKFRLRLPAGGQGSHLPTGRQGLKNLKSAI